MPNKASTRFHARKRLIAAAISACFASAPAWANPTAPQVVSGSASFNQAGTLLTVTNSNGAIINWNTFSIGAGETTRFNQLSASSSVLNRVLANDPSVLLGTLSSNGRVWLVNPAGIMVGQGARVDVAGFVASTLNVRNEDFLAARLNFQSTPNAGKVENYGQITTPSGGSVYLVAPAVTNNGIIDAPNGEVLLAAGQKVDLIDTGTPGVKVEITGAEGTATNLGQIVSEAGRIGMAGVLVKNSGSLNASSVVREGGRVFLKASQDASAGGTISATSDAAQGGRIEIAGPAVAVPDGAALDASGKTQGGTILVGGGYQGKDASIANADATTIASSAILKANATGTGDGGLIVAWSDGHTSAHGDFSAQGGDGGRGGLVETSGKASLDVAGAQVDTRAADGSAGTWLLDPADITIIHASATGSPVYAPSGSTSNIADGDINASLVTTNVSVTTSSGSGGSGNITVNGSADTSGGGSVNIYTSGSGARTLTLNADGNIAIHGGAYISGSTSAPLNLNLYAGGGITHAGSIYTYGNANLLSKGAIGFGDTSGYSGNLYSYGASVNLLANWDGASTTTPAIATSGQCGGSFCGISGSGYIESYPYYTSSVNAGAISLKAPGDVNLSNISIYALGNSGSNYGSSGGGGGTVSLSSTQGNLTTSYINANGGSGISGMYGTSGAVNGGTGGAGGAGGTVTLSAVGTLTLGGTINLAGAAGGTGGSAYQTYDSTTSSYVYNGTGGNGGAGGNAGTLSVSGASLVLSGSSLSANGGAGGSGGSGTTAGSVGAVGSASSITLATAGDIVLSGYSNYVNASQLNLFAGKSITFGTTGTSTTYGYLYSEYGAPMSLIANWNGSATAPDIATSAQCSGSTFCGISGSGSINSNYYYSALGNVGAVTVKAPGDIDLTNIGIYANGNSGYSYGSNGGAGGAVSITSTQGNLTASSINASGGSGSSGMYGTSSAVNGGTGGAGGVGGTVSLSAAGTLTLGGWINVGGGSGGYGGSAYQTYDSTTSSYVYNGTGGNGGAGGNAGTLSVNGASLVLSGANLNAVGGSGGSGGQGTAAGSLGAIGTASPITLATAGDILLTGYSNYVNASQLNLFAGKSITFGTTGTSTTYGYLYSDYGTPISLIANWNGSTTAPDIAASGQCSGSTYCGISGSGSINTNWSYYYNSLAIAGAVTLNAPGNIDLTNIGIYANGGYGYNSGSVGGAGGAVGITSTNGNLTIGSIDVSGGSGGYGVSGNSSASNGGAGGAGGAGGTINLSAAGTLNLVGSTSANGGYGGSGGSGSSTYDSTTYTYNFSGTGGNGGVGGNAGTINASGTSLVLSGASLSANGGSGGTGGQGTTLGSSGVGGTGGNITLTATTGDLTTGYNINAIGGSGGYGVGGTSSVVNGGTGGAGGAGGTIGLNAAGTLTLSGMTNVSGGYGGSGANGYYPYNSSTQTYAYSGTGGNGGAGGNAGTLSVNGASLVLSAANLNAVGGTGGPGGSGTTAGTAGANGGASAITLSTAGEITVTGSDWVNASQLNLFAGKSITFGTAATSTASATSGYLSSGYYGYYGAAASTPISLLANWDGVSTMNPTIATTGQCAGSTFCGISGSGAIDTNYYYNNNGNASAITLKAAGDIDLTNIGISANGSYYYYTNASLAGGAGGAVSITSTQGNVTTSSIDAGGGGGGPGTTGTSSAVDGGPGGAGGAGGTVSLNAAGTLTLGGWTNVAGGYGGQGGVGYYDSSLSSPAYTSAGGAGGAGGNAGTLSVRGASVVASGANLNAYGGGGGSSGQGTTLGSSGVGGAGGNITLTATTGDLATGQIVATGGSGGYGASGISSAVTGAKGAAGGSGGVVSLNAAGGLLLSGYIDASGGHGGSGGNGYYDYSLATPAYSSAGGAGGAGGNAGAIALSGASITLDNANIRVLGGYPGMDNTNNTNGMAAGAAGTFGADNTLQLAATGDITVLGYNNLAASKVALLAGKAITLGSGASGINGDINSTGTDTLLVANWNGSAGTPDVASAAQCGAAFCGISGIGSISNGYDYYNEYYYTGNLQNQNGGTITLKAAGPIDLSAISINSIGGGGNSYYYLGTQEAGNGGVVTIISTQGDVTLGDVNVVGGYGRYSTSGTATDPNGGAGGAGGAGGSINASASGSLILSGHVDASGGGGGSGGDGYYDYSLAIPAYTGAGGMGGAGGNAGTMNLSGASIVLSGASLSATGGPGGAGGYGDTPGQAGSAGTGGNLALSATGNVNLDSASYIFTGGNLMLKSAGSLSISDTIDADGSVALVAGGDLTLGSGAAITASATGGALVLAASGNFINNAGTSALFTPNGNWLVYSTNPTLDTKGGLAADFKQYGMSYTGVPYAGPGTGNGFIYSVAPAITASLTGSTNKVYDGTTAASLTPANYTLTGGLDGDTIVLDNPATGAYADKNVGTGKNVSTNVTLIGATNGTANVYGYTLASPTASGAIGSITQRPLSKWNGTSGGLWSDPNNWDAIPDGANVLAVSIPSVATGGGFQVTYDTSAGSTSLQTLTSAQTLALTGGSLTISGKLDTAGFTQSGGTLGGTGNLSVNNNFSQTGGTITLTGSASAAITQAMGDLVIQNLTAPTVALTALAGGVSQSGPIVAPVLITKSVTGTNLTDTGNQIGSFSATNSGAGAIVLTSQGALSLAGIDNKGGSVTLSADSVVTASSQVSATSDVNAEVTGDIKLNDGSSFVAGNDIRLTLKGASSTLYLNEQSGSVPSYLWAKAPSTIYLDYTARTSGGLVVDGAAMDVNTFKTSANSSGLFYGQSMTPAALDAGLGVTGIARPPAVSQAVEQTIATVTSTITSSTTAATTTATATTDTTAVVAPPPPAPATTSGTLLLGDTNQTVGGTAGTFGGSPTPADTSSGAPAASTSGAQGDKPADDKAASAKKDDKKEDDKKKEEEAQPKKADKPAAKKLATCG